MSKRPDKSSVDDVCAVCGHYFEGEGWYEENGQRRWIDGEKWEQETIDGVMFFRHAKCRMPDVTGLLRITGLLAGRVMASRNVKVFENTGEPRWIVPVIYSSICVAAVVYVRAATDTECKKERQRAERQRADAERLYCCSECGHECKGAELGDEALYECGECGQKFAAESNRCEDCNRFAEKIAERGCPQCNEGEMLPADSPVSED